VLRRIKVFNFFSLYTSPYFSDSTSHHFVFGHLASESMMPKMKVLSMPGEIYLLAILTDRILFSHQVSLATSDAT
jgi:hypothetical protein